MKKYTFIIVAVVAILVIASLFSACDDRPLPTNDRELLAYKSEGEYTVWSFNIRLETPFEIGTPWEDRKDALFEYIDTSGADILCLQEVTTTQYQDLVDGIRNYQIIWYPRDSGDNAEGLAILHSEEFTPVAQECFWLSETPDVQSLGWGASYPRICVRAELKHTSGDVLDVYNVHLDHISTSAQLNGIKLVAERALSAGGNAIVAGDFNAGIESDCYAAISESFTDAADARDSLNGYTYNDWGFFDHIGDSPIDHIFLSENLNAKIFRVLYDHIGGVDGKYYSDHFAIGVRFAVA